MNQPVTPVPFDPLSPSLLAVLVVGGALVMLFWLTWLIVSLWRRDRDR